MADIRVVHVTTQETLTESGAAVAHPTVKVIATAVVANPLAGKPLAKDLSALEFMSAEVTELLAARAHAEEEEEGEPHRFRAEHR
mgnify:CR=1 FL=1